MASTTSSPRRALASQDRDDGQRIAVDAHVLRRDAGDGARRCTRRPRRVGALLAQRRVERHKLGEHHRYRGRRRRRRRRRALHGSVLAQRGLGALLGRVRAVGRIGEPRQPREDLREDRVEHGRVAHRHGKVEREQRLARADGAVGRVELGQPPATAAARLVERARHHLHVARAHAGDGRHLGARLVERGAAKGERGGRHKGRARLRLKHDHQAGRRARRELHHERRAAPRRARSAAAAATGVAAGSKAPATAAIRKTKPSESSTSVSPQQSSHSRRVHLRAHRLEPVARRLGRRLVGRGADGQRREQRHGLQTAAALRHVGRAQPRLELRPVVHQPLPEHRRQPRAAPRARTTPTFVAPEEGAQRHGRRAHLVLVCTQC